MPPSFSTTLIQYPECTKFFLNFRSWIIIQKNFHVLTFQFFENEIITIQPYNLTCVLTLDKVTTDHKNIWEYENLSLFDMLNVTLARKEQIQNYYETLQLLTLG